MRIEDTGNCLTDQDDTVDAKILELDPGESLENQYHEEKDEHWFILEGTCTIKTKWVDTVDKHQFSKDDNYYIGRKVQFSASNTGNNTCRILKIIYGENDE